MEKERGDETMKREKEANMFRQGIKKIYYLGLERCYSTIINLG